MAATQGNPNWLERMDESKVTKLHWRIMVISGMGFFTDAYDLFIIGVVMATLRDEWHPSALATGLATSTALLASALGAVVFGRVADMLGRKRVYGYECLVLAIGAIASAFSPNIAWLIVWRFVLGVGIGGDYPVSATIMSEYAGKRSRGKMVTLVFAMQAAGLVVGPLLAAALLRSSLPHDTIWRILLAVGAIPALAVFYARRKIHETPRYLLAAGNHDEFGQAARDILGDSSQDQADDRQANTVHERKLSFWQGFAKLAGNRVWLVRLIGASAAWFFMDFAYYGNTVSSPLVLAAISPSKSLYAHTMMQLVIFAVAAVPGYIVAAFTMDSLGRKAIQTIGFAPMAVSFVCLALIPGIERLVIPFLIIYGISYFFTEFGPNATTFVYPAEIFPVEARTTGHGIAAAAGKVGAFVGVFLFPFLLDWHGLLSAEMVAGLVSVLGLIVTVTMLPEPKGKSLEELAAA